MTWVFRAPRGFVDLTDPGRVEWVFSSVSAFDGYIAGLRRAGLRVVFHGPRCAEYVREGEA